MPTSCVAQAVKESWPPDYVAEFVARADRLLKIRNDARLIVGAREYYRTRPVEFIEHWCVTYDPRNAGTDTPTTMPFVLFKRQREFIDYLVECLKAEENGLVEKCRDMGATWLCAGFSVWLWLYWPGAAVGWGSRKEELVDKLGDPKSVFEKIRKIIDNLPRELLPVGFDRRSHCAFMKFINPENDATITGEAGDNIGRGGRTLIYFKDESAHYEHPELIEAALGDNTRVQIDISSVNGPNNIFHRRREAGRDWAPGCTIPPGETRVFVMDWRDHPAKTQEWYDRRRRKAEQEGLLHVFEQEVNRNYYAAIQGVIIPIDWIRAAIDAHLKLGFEDDGGWCGGLDVADEGGDLNALALRKGVVLRFADDWADRDTGVTTRRAVDACSNTKPIDLQYDCIGVGAGVKAEANRLRDESLLPDGINLVPWDAGSGPLVPEENVVRGDKKSPLNKDFYGNLKAQGWWQLRLRFERTYRALHEPDFTWVADDLISLPSSLPKLRQIEKELAQPTSGQSGRLKLIVNKKPEGTRSPNIGDAIMMSYWPVAVGADLKKWAKLAG